MYYNYHAQARKLISEGHLVKSEILDKWNSIAPALVLYFDNHKPMPIRQYRWDEYLQFIDKEESDGERQRSKAPSSKEI